MRNETLDNFAIKFIQEHFNEIDLSKLHWNIKTIEEAIAEINSDPTTSSWIIGEVMFWGCSTNYFEKIEVEYSDEEYRVIKVDGRYFKLDTKKTHCYVEVFPKVVMVEKLIFES